MKKRSLYLMIFCWLVWITCAAVSCKPKSNADDDGATAEQVEDDVSASDDTQDEESDTAKSPQAKKADDEDRKKRRQAAENAKIRFLDPTLVQEVQARSGLIALPAPDVRHLLLRADLRDVLRYTGPIEAEILPGREPDGRYNSLRYAMGRELGCSIQRWVYPDSNELDIRFDTYIDTLQNPEKEPRVDAATYFSTFAGVRMVVMRHNDSRSMIELACTESFLTRGQLRELSERVIARL